MASGGSSLAVVLGLLIAVNSVEHRFSGVQASVVAAHGLSGHGTQTSLLRSMWNLPGPGIKPMFPALAGRFPITGPPGKSSSHLLTHIVCRRIIFYTKVIHIFISFSLI